MAAPPRFVTDPARQKQNGPMRGDGMRLRQCAEKALECPLGADSEDWLGVEQQTKETAWNL